jgi:uncharacterized Fe-S cluster-containing radical SAM superfamily protein
MPVKYIATDQADQRAEDVEKLGISDLWTPRQHYRWSKSRYGGHVSTAADSGYQSRLFMCGMCYNFCLNKLVDYMVHHFTYS